MICNCTMAGTPACCQCPNYRQRYGNSSFYYQPSYPYIPPIQKSLEDRIAELEKKMADKEAT